jgi:hypothetical protein
MGLGFLDSRGATGAIAMWLAAMALAVVFFGAALPSPLYPLYRSAFGFGGMALTLIYAV